ncbi:hypothetical protein BKA64DRAFT_768309 [Cadophora sp. MPI-SDFR-AT-0126]|nr:hypothetical protein BKA64DRAFT_768309 [Leotiomycetes sp. MPI-SDFR-AT-0126]
MDHYGYQGWQGQGNGGGNRGGRGGNRGGFRGGNRGGYGQMSQPHHVVPAFHPQGTLPNVGAQPGMHVAAPIHAPGVPPHVRANLPITPPTGPAAMTRVGRSDHLSNLPTPSPAAPKAMRPPQSFNSPTQPAARSYDKWARHIADGLVRNGGTPSSQMPAVKPNEGEDNVSRGLDKGVSPPKEIHHGIDRAGLAQRINAEKEVLAQNSDRAQTSTAEKTSVSGSIEPPATTLLSPASTNALPMPTPPTSPAEKSSLDTAESSQAADEPRPVRDANGFIRGEAKLNRRFLPTLVTPDLTQTSINPKTSKVFTEEEWTMQVRVRDARRLERASKKKKEAKMKHLEVKALLEGKDDLPVEEKLAIIVKGFEEKCVSLEQLRDSHIAITTEKDKFKKDLHRANAASVNYRNDLEQAQGDMEKERKEHGKVIRSVEEKLAEKEEMLDSALKRSEEYSECKKLLKEAEDRCASFEAELTICKNDLDVSNGRCNDLKKDLEECGIQQKNMDSEVAKASQDLQASRERCEELEKQLADRCKELQATNDRNSAQDDILRQQGSETPGETADDRIIGDVLTTAASGSKMFSGEEETFVTPRLIYTADINQSTRFGGRYSKKTILSLIGLFSLLLLSPAFSGIFGTTPPAVEIAPEFESANQQLVFNTTTGSSFEAPSTSAVAPIPTSTVATYTSAIPDGYFASFQQIIEAPDNSSFIEEEARDEWMKEGICEYEEFPMARKAIYTAALAVGIHGFVWLSPMVGV